MGRYSGYAAAFGRHSRLPPTLWTWCALGLIVLIVAYLLYGESLKRVAQTYSQPEFSHGYIIPLISTWLVAQRRHLIWKLRGPGAISGCWLVGLGVAIAVFAKLANIDSLPYLGLIPFLIGFAAATLGWASARLVVIPVLFLGFGFPLPNGAQVKLSTELQLLSSQIGTAILRGLSIPVYLDGNVIDLGRMKLQVAEACSGLRYLLPLLTFGVLCAYIYRAPRWTKLVVILATIPLAVVLNGARIAITGLFVHFDNLRMAEGFMHLLEGWVVFLIALACLFATMWLLLRLIGHECTFIDMLDFGRMAGSPEGREPQRPTSAGPSIDVTSTAVPRVLLGATATAMIGAILLLPIHHRPHYSPDRPGLFTYPLQMQKWRGTLDVLERAEEQNLGTDDYFLADYVDSAATARVNLWVAYYDSLLKDGSHIHKPTLCLPGAGWEYVDFNRFETGLIDLSQRPLTVNRGVVVHGTRRIVLYFWLELRGRHVLGQEARLHNLWDSLTLGRSDGALIRVYTPLRADEDPADGDERLLRFLRIGYPHLAPHVGA